MILAATLAATVAASASAQTVGTPEAIWSGWAQCRIDVRGPGYVSQHTHTWQITGATPTVQGAFRIYPAQWSVTGSGSLHRSEGSQSLTAQWTTRAELSAPISVVVRASDGRTLIQAGHAQLRAAGATAGVQHQTIDGRLASSKRIAAEALEWAFPAIQDATTSTHITGSTTTTVPGSVGLMQPAGSQVTAACSWDFARAGGAVSPVPPPPPPPQTMAATPPNGTAVDPATPPIATNPATTSPATPPVTPPPTMTATTLPLQVLTQVPAGGSGGSTSSPPAGGETAAENRPLASAVAAAPWEPNNSESAAKPLGELRMRGQPLAIEGNFDVESDREEWFTVRVIDDGTPPEASVLQYRDHHLVISFVNPAYQLGDYPLYRIEARAITGLAVTRTSETKMSPDVTLPWAKTNEDDSKIFLIRIVRITGLPSSNLYRLVLQADYNVSPMQLRGTLRPNRARQAALASRGRRTNRLWTMRSSPA